MEHISSGIMNFQGLLKIENSDFYLDIAFKKAKEKSDQQRDNFKLKKNDDRIKKSKSVENVRIEVISDSLVNRLNKILEAYPSLDGLPYFYNELVRITLDYVRIKKSFGAINWVIKKVREFQQDYSTKINRTRDISKINVYRREFYGRISSLLKRIKKELAYLEEARKIMKEFPTVKTSMPTVSLFGFPNIGKTTLMYKLTGSKPEIKEYAFTTKGINVAYIKEGKKKIQILDTPGSLDRFDKMNYMEQQAYLALKHCTQMIVYVFDLTEPYPLDKQVKLFNKTKKDHNDKNLVVYMSKADILGKEKKFEEFKKKYNAVSDSAELKKEIMKIKMISQQQQSS